MKSTKDLARELGLLRKRPSASHNQIPVKFRKTYQIFSHLIVIDFESTCWKDTKTRPQEIIEFPAVLLNTSTGKIESEFHHYVQPQECHILSDFCTELTGIKQDDVDQGIPLRLCLSRFSSWLWKLAEEKKLVYNVHSEACPNRCTFVTWSDWDLGVCLLYETRRKQLRKPAELNSWIDLRATYKKFYERRPNGLNGALQDVGIQFEGREHSGLHDARNTAQLAWKMMCDGCVMQITKSIQSTNTGATSSASSVYNVKDTVLHPKSAHDVDCMVSCRGKLGKPKYNQDMTDVTESGLASDVVDIPQDGRKQSNNAADGEDKHESLDFGCAFTESDDQRVSIDSGIEIDDLLLLSAELDTSIPEGDSDVQTKQISHGVILSPSFQIHCDDKTKTRSTAPNSTQKHTTRALKNSEKGDLISSRSSFKDVTNTATQKKNKAKVDINRIFPIPKPLPQGKSTPVMTRQYQKPFMSVTLSAEKCITPQYSGVTNRTFGTTMMKTPPMCECGRRSKKKFVQNPGPNMGKPFFCCPSGKGGKKSGCKFFKWDTPSTGGVNGSFSRYTTPILGTIGGQPSPRFVTPPPQPDFNTPQSVNHATQKKTLGLKPNVLRPPLIL